MMNDAEWDNWIKSMNSISKRRDILCTTDPMFGAIMVDQNYTGDYWFAFCLVLQFLVMMGMIATAHNQSKCLNSKCSSQIEDQSPKTSE